MQEALKLSSDTDMHDWFLERDAKMPQVILNDKLMTDALLGTLPIKTEHSYSLNSDGDSIPDSPISLQNKMEGKSIIPKHTYQCVRWKKCNTQIFFEVIIIYFYALISLSPKLLSLIEQVSCLSQIYIIYVCIYMYYLFLFAIFKISFAIFNNAIISIND